jgi:hypothetical protein
MRSSPFPFSGGEPEEEDRRNKGVNQYDKLCPIQRRDMDNLFVFMSYLFYSARRP